MTKLIAVHSSTFHADDSLSVYFLHQTEEFQGARVVRTRDQAIIDSADVVADVGGVYNHAQRRYDHHQVSFTEKFPGSDIPCASCGIIYFHFGREIITNVLHRLGRDPGEHIEFIFKKLYFHFVKEIDAIDNGVDQFPAGVEPAYTIHTDISSRIAMLNPHWKSVNPNPDAEFLKAVDLIGKEFEASLIRVFDSDVPAVVVTTEAYRSRFEIDPSGQIMAQKVACSFEGTLKTLERAAEDEANAENSGNPKISIPKMLYVISPRDDGTYMVKAVGTGIGFELRKPLPHTGLRDDELSKACGIPGGVFVHKSGFLAGFKSLEASIQFAKYALNYPA